MYPYFVVYELETIVVISFDVLYLAVISQCKALNFFGGKALQIHNG